VVIEEQPLLAGIEEIFLVMTVTVLMSAAAHRVTAAPLTRWLAADEPPTILYGTPERRAQDATTE
jgi:NhaP-type Na+/H+ or K+/H+ antiporter